MNVKNIALMVAGAVAAPFVADQLDRQVIAQVVPKADPKGIVTRAALVHAAVGALAYFGKGKVSGMLRPLVKGAMFGEAAAAAYSGWVVTQMKPTESMSMGTPGSILAQKGVVNALLGR